MNSEFKNMVNSDIEEVQRVLKEDEYTNEFYKGIVSKYHNYIYNLVEGLYGYSPSTKFYHDVDKESLRDNLIVLKNKLIAFKAYGYSNNKEENGTNITLANNNFNQIGIAVTFNDVRQKIEEMNSLREEEIQEILEKVNELEKILNSENRKSKKWEMCNGIIKWMADKGVEVAISLLPLIIEGFK